jgi:hypothetical protein
VVALIWEDLDAVTVVEVVVVEEEVGVLVELELVTFLIGDGEVGVV